VAPAERVLVAGLARAGTTWAASALGLADGARLISEPDHPRTSPFGFRVARHLGYMPVLEPPEMSPEYERLWEQAFGVGGDARPSLGGRVRTRVVERAFIRASDRTLDRAIDGGGLGPDLAIVAALASPRTVDASVRVPVAKTVTAMFSLEWISERWSPRVVIVTRHPLDVVASRLDLGARPVPWLTDPKVRRQFERVCGAEMPEAELHGTRSVAWRVGVLTALLQAKAAAHPDWLLVTHEWLCEEPGDRFRGLFADVGLGWTDDVERFLEERNAPGTGYEISRVAGEQRGRWRIRLDENQIREACEVLARFPVDWSAFGGAPW
jgi:hypothetical protein